LPNGLLRYKEREHTAFPSHLRTEDFDALGLATAKTDQPLLQNVWQEVKYRPDVRKVTNGGHTELA
jgi:hypothetical protein